MTKAGYEGFATNTLGSARSRTLMGFGKPSTVSSRYTSTDLPRPVLREVWSRFRLLMSDSETSKHAPNSAPRRCRQTEGRLDSVGK